jgi:beta-glucanase (GH16 family)
MHKIFSFFTLIIIASLANLNAQQYVQVWSDEFSSPVLNSANWTTEIGTGSNGWGNNELQYYTSRPENVTIQNGNLLIIAKKENYQGSEYTSARIKTQAKQNWKYGKMEARIKLPVGQGLWPAFWMLGENITSVSWPNCGEIDIMEHINSEPKIFGTMHWDANGHAYYGGDVNVNDVTQFHIYSVEWDSTGIKWFVDGTNYWQANTLNNINSTEEFHNPFFFLLNIAVGGNFPGPPTANSILADTMEVDYVRVFQKQTFPNSVYNLNKENSHCLLYPNPVRNSENLNIYFEQADTYEIELIDMFGRILYYDNIITSNPRTSTLISLASFKSGNYELKCKQQNHISYERLIIVE